MGKLMQHVALEAVDFQSSAFFKSLTIACEAIKEVAVKDKEGFIDSSEAGSLKKIVAEFTDMKIFFAIDWFEPCVEIPAIDKNHPFINAFLRPYFSSEVGLKMIEDADHSLRGSVNIITGKVNGVFKEMDTTIHLPRDMFTGKYRGQQYSPEEIASIILHEVGHMWSFFEFIGMTTTTNQVLSGMSKALDKSGTVDEREIILTSVKKALKLDALDVKDLAKNTNKKSIELVVISNAVKDSRSQLGTQICDFSTWEMAADQYATRYGAGRELQSALVKIYKSIPFGGDIGIRGTAVYMCVEAMKILLLIVSIPMLTLGYSPFALFYLIMIIMDGAGDGTYDRPGARAKRIRNQLVERLKDKSLATEEIVRLQTDIKALDESIAMISDRRQLTDVIWDFVSPTRRRHRTALQLQQELESLALNDLFVKAAEFRTL